MRLENVVPARPSPGLMEVTFGLLLAVTLNPLNGDEILSGVATESVRVTASADGEIEIVIGTEVGVSAPEIAAVIPAPLNVTEVTPLRFVPVIVAGIVAP